MSSGYFRSPQYKTAQVYLYVTWTSRKKNDKESYLDVDVDVQCYSLRCIAAEAYIQILGTDGYNHGKYNYTAPAYNKPNSWGRANMGNHTFTIGHNSDGNKRVKIKAYWKCNLTDGYSGIYISSLTAEKTIDLISLVPAKPGAPTNFKVSGTFEEGERINLSWTKGSGTVSSYELQYRLHLVSSNGASTSWSPWYVHTSSISGGATSYTFTTPSFNSTNYKYAYEIQFSIGARNAGGTVWNTYGGPHPRHYGPRRQNGDDTVHKACKMHVWDEDNGWINDVIGRKTQNDGSTWEVIR